MKEHWIDATHRLLTDEDEDTPLVTQVSYREFREHMNDEMKMQERTAESLQFISLSLLAIAVLELVVLVVILAKF